MRLLLHCFPPRKALTLKGGDLVSNDTTDEKKVALSNELRNLVRKSKGHEEFMLPESVELAIKDWRYWDVPKYLQKRCDELKQILSEGAVSTTGEEPHDENGNKEYVWLRGLLIEWGLLDEKFVTSGIEYALPR